MVADYQIKSLSLRYVIVQLTSKLLMNLINIIPLFLGNIGMTEILIIAFVILLLFGEKKIPELMRGIGKGVSSFKQGMNDIQDEITKPVNEKNDSPKE